MSGVFHRQVLTAVAIVLALAISLPNWAAAETRITFDGGGRLENEVGPLPGWHTGRVYLVDRLEAGVNLRQRLEVPTIDYNLAGYFRYTSEREVSGDLTELNAALSLPGFPGPFGRFHASMGRVVIDEPSGFVFHQSGDGLSTGLSFPRFEVVADIGYLGLLLKDSNQALLSAADRAALTDSSVVLAPSRGVGVLRFRFPHLLLRTDLDLWGLYLLGFGTAVPAGRWYAGITAAGPVWGPLRQRLDFVGGAELSGRFSFLARGAVLLELPRLVDSTGGLELIFASGETSNLGAFLPLTGDVAGVILSAPYQNLIRLSLDYSLRPMQESRTEWLRPLRPFLASRWYFRQSPTPALPFAYDPPQNYYGTELEAGLAFRHNTDPELKVSSGFFADAGAELQWFGRATLNLSF